MSDWDESAKEREAQLKRDRERILEQKYMLCAAVGALGKSREGQEFLRWVMAECGVFEQEFPQDEKASAWNAGRRAFGLKVLALCAEEGLTPVVLDKLMEVEINE